MQPAAEQPSAADNRSLLNQAERNADPERYSTAAAVLAAEIAKGGGLSDSATNAEVMAYQMRQAGFDGEMVPTGGSSARDGRDRLMMNGAGQLVSPDSIESLRQSDGTYRVEIAGTSDSPVVYGNGNGGGQDPEAQQVIITGKRMTDAEKAAYDAEQAQGLLQAQNDAQVIAGSYNKFGSAWDSAMSGNWSQAWSHLNYTPSPAARQAVYNRVFPQPDPRFARVDAARGGVFGAGAVIATQNASPRDQYYAAQVGAHVDALSGSVTGVYKQTLTAQAPIPGTLASGIRRTGQPMPPLPGASPFTRRGVVEFGGLEVRAVRDLGHVDVGTLRAMQQYGFAAKDINGNSLVLHHHRQNPAGPIIEMPGVNHNIGNRAQHPFGNTKGAGLTPEQRADFDLWRVDYWKWRATQELLGRGLP